MRRRCNVKENREWQPGRGRSHGITELGKMHKRVSASDQIKGTLPTWEYKRMKGGAIRTNERPSAELIALANKRSARFDRW